MQDIHHSPTETPHLRPQLIALIAIALVIVGLGFANVFFGLKTTHHSPLHPLDEKLVSHLAAAQSPAPPDTEWVESRDGDGTLDVEDVNGPATIYFDKQSRTRLLCVQNTGCYHLSGHHEASK
jgi:hypothetical protein